MNDRLRELACQELLDGLEILPDTAVKNFKKMYGRKAGVRSESDALEMRLEDILHEMSDDKLDWAMRQVERSIRKVTQSIMGHGTPQLKPCPFCGEGRWEEDDSRMVLLHNPECFLMRSNTNPTIIIINQKYKKDMIAWNRRASRRVR